MPNRTCSLCGGKTVYLGKSHDGKNWDHCPRCGSHPRKKHTERRLETACSKCRAILYFTQGQEGYLRCFACGNEIRLPPAISTKGNP